MLAQRSAEAARQIKALIGSSVDKVEAGSRLVVQAPRSSRPFACTTETHARNALRERGPRMPAGRQFTQALPRDTLAS
jgi:hypothetical protein